MKYMKVSAKEREEIQSIELGNVLKENQRKQQKRRKRYGKCKKEIRGASNWI